MSYNKAKKKLIDEIEDQIDEMESDKTTIETYFASRSFLDKFMESSGKIQYLNEVLVFVKKRKSKLKDLLSDVKQDSDLSNWAYKDFGTISYSFHFKKSKEWSENCDRLNDKIEQLIDNVRDWHHYK